MFEIIVSNKDNEIVDRITCGWLLSYDKPTHIDDLIKFCENKIESLAYNVYIIDNTNIDKIKDAIKSHIDIIDNISDLMDYLKNKSYRLEKDFYDITFSDRDLIEQEIFRFESLKEFLLKHKYSENILEYSS